MMKSRLTITLFCLLLVLACSKEVMDLFRGFEKPVHFPEPVYNMTKNPVTAAGFALGKMLFFDSTLSVDQSTSCGSCHMPSSAFTHHEHDFSHGLNGALTTRNAPPLFNLAWSNSFMWDGSVAELDMQPVKPLTNPMEMGMQMPEILRMLNASNMYRRMFADAFETPVASEEKIMKALSQVKVNNGLMGRWESIQDNPRVILDVAHNEHGIHALLEQLASSHYQQLHIVTGMVKDKDIQAVLQLLPKNALYYFTQSHIPRALPVDELAAQAKSIGLNGTNFEDVNIALHDAIKNAHHNDLILVIGSVYLVAEVDRTKY